MAAASSTAELFALSPSTLIHCMHLPLLIRATPPPSAAPVFILLLPSSNPPPPLLFLFPILFRVFRVEGEGNQYIYFIHFISGKASGPTAPTLIVTRR